MDQDKRYLTQEGKEQLEKELRFLIDVERNKVIEELQDARAQGDLSENADYDSARRRQAEVESRIKEVESMLAHAEIITNDGIKNKNLVRIGSAVKIRNNVTGEKVTYRIVDSVETSPGDGKISYGSPLAEAILGRKVGDKSVVKVKKPYEIVIEAVDNN